MDREVIEDVPAAIRDVTLRVVRKITGRGRGISGNVDPSLERAATAVAVKLDIDDPRSTEHFRTVVLLLMVALLGLVVLSSVLLG